MDIIRLGVYAEGYSGQTYNEIFCISNELYQQIKYEIAELKLYINDLDGKYSEVERYIDVSNVTEIGVQLEQDGYILYRGIEDICKKKNLDLKEDTEKTKRYLEENNLLYSELSVIVKTSQRSKLLEYVKTLNKSNPQQLLNKGTGIKQL